MIALVQFTLYGKKQINLEKKCIGGKKNTAVRHKELTADPVTMWTGAFGLV